MSFRNLLNYVYIHNGENFNTYSVDFWIKIPFQKEGVFLFCFLFSQCWKLNPVFHMLVKLLPTGPHIFSFFGKVFKLIQFKNLLKDLVNKVIINKVYLKNEYKKFKFQDWYGHVCYKAFFLFFRKNNGEIGSLFPLVMLIMV
jgi:hypothetical protein